MDSSTSQSQQTERPSILNYMEDIAKLDGRFRFCTVQTYDGQRRHFICGHHEYCCALACCVSTAFSFYQLWYFWLLILLIILLCSGGGWWFRWRHGNFGGRSATPSQGRRRQGRNHGGGRPSRVYPNGYSCNLPPGYDKDPPSYTEVISHLSQFPRADTRYPGIGNNSVGGNLANPTGPADMNQLLAVPPPSYQMVLDLKRREDDQNNEILEAERLDRVQSSRGRIQTLLGRARRKRSDQTQPPSAPLPPPVGSFPSAPPYDTSDATRSSGLFTISRESLPPIDVYPHQSNPPSIQRPVLLTQDALQNREGLSPTGSGSHSDYSSSFLSTPSSVSRSSSASLTPPGSPPSYEAMGAPSIRQTSGDRRSDDLLEVGVGVDPRPCTGRSTLSRPTTSISTRSLPVPEEIPRKPSLPGALVESDVEEEEENGEGNTTPNQTTNTNTNTTTNNNSTSNHNTNNDSSNSNQ